MARMTADDFVTLARLGLGGETTETISDAQILRLVNQAHIEVCSAFPFPELEKTTTITTSSGTAEYDLSVTDVLLLYEAVDTTNGLQLDHINRYQYNQYTQGTSTASGTPVYWYISGVNTSGAKQITFYPEPAGTYSVTMYYRRRPDDLTQSPAATSPYIPEVWDDSILQRAISRGWKLLGDLEMAGKFMALAKENDRAAVRVSLKGSDVPIHIGSIAGIRTGQF